MTAPLHISPSRIRWSATIVKGCRTSDAWWLLALVLACTVSLSAGESSLPQPIRVVSGLLMGVVSPDAAVVSFKGIPYAAPPVGELRWREPRPPLAWDGVRLANQFGASCPQPKSPSGKVRNNTSEDCLFLNIWTPARSATDRLPILFYIHGGAWNFGAGDIDGEPLARKGVIVVSLNYRLGIFCGMGHPELTAESPEHSCGNYGELDLIAGLQWVHDNITAFGGDPRRVTIAGQSSGAHAVHYLTASPKAKGLLSGAIALSFSYDYLTKPNVIGNVWQKEQFGLKFAAVKGVTTLQELRALSPAELLSDAPGVEARTRAVLGGGVNTNTQSFPLQYPKALDAGLPCDVPTMTGFTADEFTLPAPFLTISAASFPASVAKLFKDQAPAFSAIADDFLAHCNAATDEQAKVQFKHLLIEQMTTSTFAWATRRAKKATTPAFLYLFDHQVTPEKGAPHGADLAFAFHNQQDSWNVEDHAVADVLSSYWVAFITTGDPHGGMLPAWPAFAADRPVAMFLNAKPGMRPIADAGRLPLYQAMPRP